MTYDATDMLQGMICEAEASATPAQVAIHTEATAGQQTVIWERTSGDNKVYISNVASGAISTGDVISSSCHRAVRDYSELTGL